MLAHGICFNLVWLWYGHSLYICSICIPEFLGDTTYFMVNVSKWISLLVLPCLYTGISPFRLYISQGKYLNYNILCCNLLCNLTMYWPGFASALGESRLPCIPGWDGRVKLSCTRLFKEECGLPECWIIGLLHRSFSEKQFFFGGVWRDIETLGRR